MRSVVIIANPAIVMAEVELAMRDKFSICCTDEEGVFCQSGDGWTKLTVYEHFYFEFEECEKHKIEKEIDPKFAYDLLINSMSAAELFLTNLAPRGDCIVLSIWSKILRLRDVQYAIKNNIRWYDLKNDEEMKLD